MGRFWCDLDGQDIPRPFEDRMAKKPVAAPEKPAETPKATDTDISAKEKKALYMREYMARKRAEKKAGK